MSKVIRNRCKCAKCGDVIESRTVHEFKTCKCGAIFTDGGTKYVRRGFTDPSDIIDLSEYDGEEIND